MTCQWHVGANVYFTSRVHDPKKAGVWDMSDLQKPRLLNASENIGLVNRPGCA